MRTLANLFWVLIVSTLMTNIAWGHVEATLGTIPLSANKNLAIQLPQTEASEVLISRDQYLISYNKNHRAPNWVAWKLELSQLGKVKRSDKFTQDAELEKYLVQAGGSFHAVMSTDYKNSCFDRGHQIPSGDRTDTKENNEATFNMSNMIPQTPYLNRVIWEHLEEYTRELIQKQGKKVYVIAGPIYDINYGSVGPNGDIPVPSKDFKIIFILDADQTVANITSQTPKIAVIMPNVLDDGSVPVPMTPDCGGSELSADETTKNKDDWKQYQTTIPEIEKAAALSFPGIDGH